MEREEELCNPKKVPEKLPQDLKKTRGARKASLTKIINSISTLMQDKHRVHDVAQKIGDFENAFADFADAHRQFDQLLVNEDEVKKSEVYWKKTETESAEFRTVVNHWLDDNHKRDIEDDINISDSVSQHDRTSRVSSKTSTTSSTASARLRARAEKAALEAEAKTMGEQNDIELEALHIQMELQQRQLKLQQRRKEMDLKVKIARAEALERAFAEAEEVNRSDVCFTQSTPYPKPTGKTTPKHPPECKTNASVSAQANNVYENNTPGCPISRPSRISWTPSAIPHESSTSANSSDMGGILCQMLSDSRVHQQSLVEALQLPKADLMTFDGNPLKYWAFIRTFENTIDLDTINSGAKLARLMQCCTGKVKQLLQCCMVKEPLEGYTLALRLLRERYGHEHNISQAWIEKVTERPNIVDNVSLQDFADDLRCCRETLDTMGYLSELNNRGSLLSIVEKLPHHLKARWLREVHNIKTKQSRSPSIDDVLHLVTTAAEEVSDPVFGKILQKGVNKKESKPKDCSRGDRRVNFGIQTTAPITSIPRAQTDEITSSKSTSSLEHCPSCGQAHYLNQCDAFKAMKVKDRLAFVQSKKLCVNCFRPGHIGRDCTRHFVCSISGCGKKHNKYLHLPRPQDKSGSSTTSVQSTQRTTSSSVQSAHVSTDGSPTVSCTFAGAGFGKVALPIVAVKVRGQREQHFVNTYALLDTGSTQSFCSEELMRRLKIPGRGDNMKLTTLEQKDVQVDTFVVSIEVSDLDDQHIHVYSMPTVLTRPQLNVGLHNLVTQEELQRWPHLHDIALPDVRVDDVHLLIGQDAPDMMVPQEVRLGCKGEPYATKTALGWTLNGPVGNQSTPKASSSYFSKTDVDLQRQVEKFWRLGDVENNVEVLSVNEKKAISIWENSLHHDGTNYTMNIPFKERPPPLPDNRSMADHRLRLLGKRLSRNQDLKTKYIDGIHVLVEKGYAEPVSPEHLTMKEGCTWYLPHHPVLNPHKPGKVRIVFDCAARYRCISLNDTVYQGPDLTNKLIGVLLRFRQERIALMADIEGMFHQVHVNTRDALRFLWWKNDDVGDLPVVYRMTAHLFGGVWSPSCASFALKRTAHDNHTKFDENTINTVEQNFYVDDCLKSVPTEEDATRLVRQLRELLALGGFRLTKWTSNSRAVLKSVPKEEWAKTVATMDFDHEILPSERALGVLWRVESDTFGFDTNVKERPVTRRGMLSVTSSIYDPLGFVGPFVLRAKMLFQTLGRRKIGWDAFMPSDVADQWYRWLQDLPLIEEISIPRCVKPANFGVIATAQLHHFADASERGYGAVTYLRLVDEEGRTYCSIVMAKAKLAPLKSTTIPRLELAAALSESQRMADLPKDRVTSGNAPFNTVGVDLFGPFMVKRARSEVKRYGCLFTCLTTRAIHIEVHVCNSLDTDSFINALQRFISRRGEPTEIRSDNGTNFVGAHHELRRALQDWNQHQIEDYLHQNEIEWVFNTPTASHMGGIWERQIRTVRAVLGSLLRQQVIDDEEICTLMCIVEGIVNGRPITKLSDDPRDRAPLTPNHLLLLRSGPILPPGKFVKQDLFKRRWRQVQYLADIFWSRWLKEYLPSLQQRQKWQHPRRNLQVGDLVLVRYEKSPRFKWPLGLIVATYPGKDGYVRSVQVKTQAGTYDRPTDKICLLEAQLLPSEDNPP